VNEIRAVVGPAPSAVRWLVVDAEAITNLDYTAARVVRQLQRELAQKSVVLAFARVPPYLKADFDRHHLTEAVGTEMIFSRLHDALEAFVKYQEEAALPRIQSNASQ
jgi:MFS superfamily sulfate permease-like transporter